jgi:hypothetical protein
MGPGPFPIVSDTVEGGSGPAPQGTAVRWTISDIGGDPCTLDNSASHNPITGTVTVTSYAQDVRVEGTLDLHGPNGAVLGGSFDARTCGTITLASYACELIPPPGG